MHPYSPAMSAFVAAEAMAAARRAGGLPIDVAELEGYTHTVLGELAHPRPRITDYLPELALNRVLTWLDLRRRLVLARTPVTTRTASAASTLTIAADGRCRSHRQHCRPITDGVSGRELCRCSGRRPDASAWNGRLPWRNAARRTPLAA